MDNQGTPGYWGIFCPECKLFMIWLHSQRWRSQIWRFFIRPAPPPPPNSSMRPPPENVSFDLDPLLPPPPGNFAGKCGSICQWLQLVEYSSNQTLPYIGVGIPGILVICTGGPEIDSVSRRLWNNLRELAYMIPYFP